MITFRKIYELIFSSFRVNDTSHFLNELEQEKVEKVIIIKRSWIYGLYISFVFFLIIIIVGINIYFIIKNFSSLIILYGMISFIIINLMFGIFSGITYIYRFRKIHKGDSILSGVHNIDLIKSAILEEEAIFGRFFNQITTNYYLFMIITMIYTYYVIFEQGNFMNISSVSEIFFLVIQVIFIAYYRRHMIDLEMDYIIIIPNRVYFVDQIGIHKRTQSIKWMTNIRLITSSYPNFLGSLCNYGTIEIAVRSDTPAMLSNYHMRYVDNPIEIVNQINQLIEKESEFSQ